MRNRDVFLVSFPVTLVNLRLYTARQHCGDRDLSEVNARLGNQGRRKVGRCFSPASKFPDLLLSFLNRCQFPELLSVNIFGQKSDQLFDGYGFRQVPRLVHVTTAPYCDVVRE